MKHRLIPLLLALALLTGCASPLIPSEYTVVSEHSDKAVPQANDALTAENYEELRYAILSLIEVGVTEGVIRAYNYDGDVTKDISDAAYDVWKNDPVGAYAVDFLTTDCTLLLSYYEIHVKITYRRDAADAESIQYVRGASGAEEAVHEALIEMRDRLVLRISAYEDGIDCAAMVEQFFADSPETLMELPLVRTNVYPDTGSVRIVELDFLYEHTKTELRAMRTAVSGVLNSAVNYVRYRKEDRAKAEMLFSYLIERFDYQEGDTVTPVYSLLCEGIADSQTFARIFQLLCDRTDLVCYTVGGYRDGEPYDWNILEFDGIACHVDLMRCVREGLHQLAFYADDDMEGYSWDRAAYPVCAPPELPPEEEEDPAEPADGTEPEDPGAVQDPETPEDPSAPEAPEEPVTPDPDPEEPVTPPEPLPEQPGIS